MEYFSLNLAKIKYPPIKFLELVKELELADEMKQNKWKGEVGDQKEPRTQSCPANSELEHGKASELSDHTVTKEK